MKKNQPFEPNRMHQFLLGLFNNNNKVWFDEHRDEYDAIRKSFVNFVETVHGEMLNIDPSLVHMNPKKSLFRINRDVRFSRDKTPYKTHMGAKFSCTGQKKGVAGYGFGVSSEGKLYVMAGINKIETTQLNLLRDNLIEKNSQLLNTLLSKNIVHNFDLSDLGFGKLKTIPRGYPKDFEHPELLRMRAFWAMHWIDINEVGENGTEESLRKYIVEKLFLTVPLVTTMNEILRGDEKLV